MGLWPTCPPSGYLTDKSVERKGHIIIDPERGPIIRKIFKKVAYEKWSGRKIYHWLRFDLNFKIKGNKNLSLSNIYLILQNTFYYGPFEYPRGSGNWYQGNHEPLVTKELFDLALEQLKRDRIVRDSKEFAFTKLITCGHCGSGMTADEKYKKLKNGNTVKYIYYGCTRSRDHHCKAGYIREEELISQLARIIDQLDINEIGVKKQFEEELERYGKFRQIVLQMNGDQTGIPKEKEIDLRTYAKYILKQGNITEKREILTCTKSRLIFKDKKLILEKNGTRSGKK
jgi:hypothetical protein